MPVYQIDIDGNICIFDKDGRLHSFNNKPAVIWADGYLEWHRNGRLIKAKDVNGNCKEWSK